MAREAKLIITSENKASAEIKAAVRDLLGIDEAAKKVGDTLKTAFTITAIFEATKKIAEFGFESVKAFGEVERTMLQLKTALGGNETSFARMTGLIEEMAGKTLATKDEVEGLVAELASLGKSDSEIDKITRASIALSNVTGKDLNSSMLLINATFDGSAGKLSKLIPEIGNMTKAQLEAGGAVDLLNSKFGEISDSMGTGISQNFNNMQKASDDFQESLGNFAKPIFDPMISSLTDMFRAWASNIDKANAYRDALLNINSVSIEISTRAKLTIATLDLERAQEEENIGASEASKAAGITNLQEKAAFEQRWREADRAENAKRGESIADLAKRVTDLQAFLDSIAPQKRPSKQSGGGNEEGEGSSAPGTPWYSRINRVGRFFGTHDRPDADYSGVSGLERSPFSAAESVIGSATFAPRRMTGADRADAADMTLGGGGNPIAGLLTHVQPLIDRFDGLFKALGPVQAILDPLGIALQGMFDVIGPAVSEALAPLIGFIFDMGKVLGEFLLPIIKFFGDVIKGIVSFLIGLLNGIVDFVNYIFNKNISKLSLENSTADGLKVASSPPYSQSGGTASYTGAQAITFNFYNQGNVVGSGGLRELADIIDGLIKQRARYA